MYKRARIFVRGRCQVAAHLDVMGSAIKLRQQFLLGGLVPCQLHVLLLELPLRLLHLLFLYSQLLHAGHGVMCILAKGADAETKHHKVCFQMAMNVMLVEWLPFQFIIQLHCGGADGFQLHVGQGQTPVAPP